MMETDFEFGDSVANSCYKKYDSLGKIGAKPREGCEWTLMSAILIEKMNGNIVELEVVSLATGTKCIGRQSMSSDGNVINDSHAEVLARRAFLRYLYGEVEKTYKTGSSDIFSGIDNNHKCILREKIKFHLFTSHVPCGDASIMPMLGAKRKLNSNEENGGKVKKIKVDVCDGAFEIKTMKEITDCDVNEIGDIIDIHRTGAKCLPTNVRQDDKSDGIHYHIVGPVRTKPGRGDPTVSVACSDKIARWLYTGLQGALLSMLIVNGQQIFLSSITVGGGGQFNEEALHRALVQRSSLQETSNLCPQIYHSKLVFCHSRYLASQSSKPAPTSIIWYKNIIGKRQYEVAVEGLKQGCTKKITKKNMLSVCKRELFSVFLSLSKFDLSISYRQMKDKAINYQEKVKQFKENMGTWTIKDPKLEQFFCNHEDFR